MWILDFTLKREALEHWFISDISNISNIYQYSQIFNNSLEDNSSTPMLTNFYKKQLLSKPTKKQ